MRREVYSWRVWKISLAAVLDLAVQDWLTEEWHRRRLR
jgi:hypothetical protein